MFDGLDEVGTEKVLELFRSKFAEQPIFLITHDAGLKGMADNLIIISKTKRSSVIIEKRKKVKQEV